MERSCKVPGKGPMPDRTAGLKALKVRIRGEYLSIGNAPIYGLTPLTLTVRNCQEVSPFLGCSPLIPPQHFLHWRQHEISRILHFDVGFQAANDIISLDCSAMNDIELIRQYLG